MSALVPEIFKYNISVKYANETADDIKHSTQYNIRYINKAILANLLNGGGIKKSNQIKNQFALPTIETWEANSST